jgi:hypothetical protein
VAVAPHPHSPRLPMKPFNALIVILSFTTSVLSQQLTTTNAYVFIILSLLFYH